MRHMLRATSEHATSEMWDAAFARWEQETLSHMCRVCHEGLAFEDGLCIGCAANGAEGDEAA